LYFSRLARRKFAMAIFVTVSGMYSESPFRLLRTADTRPIQRESQAAVGVTSIPPFPSQF
jgi:hypothetical protein